MSGLPFLLASKPISNSFTNKCTRFFTLCSDKCIVRFIKPYGYWFLPEALCALHGELVLAEVICLALWISHAACGAFTCRVGSLSSLK